MKRCIKTKSFPRSPSPFEFILCLGFLILGLTAPTPAAVGPQPEDIDAIWSFASFGEGDFFFRPSDIAVDPALKRIYVADSGNHRIAAFDFAGNYLKSFGQEGQGPGKFNRPTGICILPDSRLAVADFGNTRIQIFDRDGKFMKTHRLCRDASTSSIPNPTNPLIRSPAIPACGLSPLWIRADWSIFTKIAREN